MKAARRRPSLIVVSPSTTSVSFFHFDAREALASLRGRHRGRLRTGFEGRCCDLYGALPDGQGCRTLCAVFRTSSPRDVVPQRGTYRVKARPYAKATVSRFQLNIVLSAHMPMQDDREFARHGDDCATQPATFIGDGHAPCLQRGPSLDAREQGQRSLHEHFAHSPIAAFGDRSVAVDFAGSVLAWG
jgi:hypothetical protein